MNMKSKLLEFTFIASALMLMASCGLQVRQNPTIPGANPIINVPTEKLYTVGGTATGVRYTLASAPLNYTDHLPNGIVLTINGEEFPITANGDFTFSKKFESGDEYEVSILDNGIAIPSNNGAGPILYLNCDLTNTTGTVIDANIVNVLVDCHIDDIPYKDTI